jgi:hypothetical protein
MTLKQALLRQMFVFVSASVLRGRAISRIQEALRTTVEAGCNVMKETEYFVLLWMSVVITEEYNVMVNREELIGVTEYLTLQARCRINRWRSNGVRLYMKGLTASE